MLFRSDWRLQAFSNGIYTDIMDGCIWRTMRGADGRLFFDEPDDKMEVRIGVTISLDWYTFLYVTLLSLTWIPGWMEVQCLWPQSFIWGPFVLHFEFTHHAQVHIPVLNYSNFILSHVLLDTTFRIY